MYTVRKLFKFEGAHALSSSYSEECQNVHGHSYKLEVIISSKKVNPDGMVIDFKELKESIKPIIDIFDHKLVYNLEHAVDYDHVPGEIGVPFNPTAENMCKFFYKEIYKIIWDVCDKLVIRLHETDTGYAEYTE